MDFKDIIKQLGEKVEKLKNSIQTEEATKNAFIMPFIQALGYDVFNPKEVVPEFISDIGIKKGEKIDYAIFKEDFPIILIECKHWSENLNLHDGQLLRYFHVSKSKFGLLTNGVVYKFYTDLVDKNKMDEKPFLEFNISEIKDAQIDELKKFHKSYFDADAISNTASDLKYMNELKALINSDFTNPSENFVRIYASQVYNGRLTEKMMEHFKELTLRSVSTLLNDIITQRLTSALKKEEDEQKANEQIIIPTLKVETTEEETFAFMIVKAMLVKTIEPSRVFMRDAQSYCAIILDDNNRKPLIRFYFNGNKKQIGFFDISKNETKVNIESLDDIYKYSENVNSIAQAYLNGN